MAVAHGCYLVASTVSTKIKMIKTPQIRDYKMKVPYKLKQGQSRTFHQLPSGLNMEVIYQKKNPNEKNLPPLVFVHGSFHGAWCWAEHWMPFFSQNGFDSYALSLLAQQGGMIKETWMDEDPREAILKYADVAEKDPKFIAPAYAQTQPTTVFANSDSEDEDK